MSSQEPAKHIEDLMVSIAHAIAKGLEPLDDILTRHAVSPAYFNSLQQNPRFHAMVLQAKKEWDAADNVTKRNEYKSSLMFEELLPEFHARMHDKSEPLTAKVKFMELLAKTAKLGSQTGDGAPSDKFTITINLGAGQQINIEERLPARVIEAEPHYEAE